MNLKIKSKKPKSENQRGVTLFIAVTIMAVLLFISFVVINIAVKSTQFVGTARESQLAFSAADAGVECALYWDTHEPNPFVVKMSTFADYYVTEFSGVDRNSPLDAKANSTGYLNGTDDPEIVYSDSVSLTYPEQLIIGWFQESHAQQVEAGSGFSTISPLRWNLLEYKTVTSGGTQSASARYPNPGHDNSDYMTNIVTFKAAAGETPSKIQNADGYITIPDPVQLTLPSASISGNFILVNITYSADTFDVASVTDNKGNAYVKAYGPYLFPSSPWASEVWYAKNITGTSGSERLTVTVNSPAFVPVNLECNGETVLATPNPWNSNDVSTNPPQPHCLGGACAEANSNTSIFQLNFENGTCAIITVEKEPGGETIIQSKGYNTCNTSNSKRVERGVEVRY